MPHMYCPNFSGIREKKLRLIIRKQLDKHLLGWVESLSLLCLELVDSELRLRVLGTDDSRVGGGGGCCCSTSSGTTGHCCLRLCRTASQPCIFNSSQPCFVLEIRPSTYRHVLKKTGNKVEHDSKVGTKDLNNLYNCTQHQRDLLVTHPRMERTSQWWAKATMSGITFSSCSKFRPQLDVPILPWTQAELSTPTASTLSRLRFFFKLP